MRDEKGRFVKRAKEVLFSKSPSTLSPEELRLPKKEEIELDKEVKVNVVPKKRDVRQSTTGTRRYNPVMSASITVIGNLTADPELRQTASGKSVVNFALAHTPRRPDGSDGQTSFYNIVAWEYLADNFAASFKKGDRLVVLGRVSQDKWTDKESEKVMTRLVITADEVGGTVRFHTCEMSKVRRAQTTESVEESTSDENSDIFA